jgi:hypothetical protein
MAEDKGLEAKVDMSEHKQGKDVRTSSGCIEMRW